MKMALFLVICLSIGISTCLGAPTSSNPFFTKLNDTCKNTTNLLTNQKEIFDNCNSYEEISKTTKLNESNLRDMRCLLYLKSVSTYCKNNTAPKYPTLSELNNTPDVLNICENISQYYNLTFPKNPITTLSSIRLCTDFDGNLLPECIYLNYYITQNKILGSNDKTQASGASQNAAKSTKPVSKTAETADSKHKSLTDNSDPTTVEKPSANSETVPESPHRTETKNPTITNSADGPSDPVNGGSDNDKLNSKTGSGVPDQAAAHENQDTSVKDSGVPDQAAAHENQDTSVKGSQSTKSNPSADNSPSVDNGQSAKNGPSADNGPSAGNDPSANNGQSENNSPVKNVATVNKDKGLSESTVQLKQPQEQKKPSPDETNGSKTKSEGESPKMSLQEHVETDVEDNDNHGLANNEDDDGNDYGYGGNTNTNADAADNQPKDQANEQAVDKTVEKKPDIVQDNPVSNENINDIDGESYFFSYFMVICVLFVLGYVGYHNRIKVMALLLEGKRGKRQQRSRRPNSANYHKLDSNLEEAISSNVTKNSNNVIY